MKTIGLVLVGLGIGRFLLKKGFSLTKQISIIILVGYFLYHFFC